MPQSSGLRVPRIRTFEIDDLDRVLAIELASFGKQAWDSKLFREYHRKCPDLFLVAVVGRRVAGYIITCVKGKHAGLESIAVDPCYRRSGVGTTMLDFTLEELRLKRVKTWGLMVAVDNDSGIAMYSSYGFKLIKRVKGYYAAGLDAWQMSYSPGL